ncbi:MAG: hypothetical protein IJR27_07305 [Synergistaceae bacterium]|nr:hypothetical protein [Synergistaceae bacterium]
MCSGQKDKDINDINGKGSGKTGKQGKQKINNAEPEIMISELLSAVSENEYPQYILDAVSEVQEWMRDMTEKPENDEGDIFTAIFGEGFDDETGGIESLFERLESIGEYADVIPNPKAPDGKPDALIVSITPPDYESGLRTAIDYAAVFNRPTCRRVWIISDTFILDDVMKFSRHVDALTEQGITLRYILVTPWGWVELPLSGMTASKHSFLWRNEAVTEENPAEKPVRHRRKKT